MKTHYNRGSYFYQNNPLIEEGFHARKGYQKACEKAIKE